MSKYRLAGYEALTGYTELIESKKLRPSQYLSRRDSELIEDLVASIIEKGLLEPIIIRPMDDGFEVVAGNRRFEACRRLKFAKVPCHVIELNDKEAYEVSLIENIQRKTLNPIEEGQAFKRYVDEYGFGGVMELARKIGKSHSYVSRRVALLSLPQSLQDELVRRRTTPSAVSELVPLDEESKATLAEHITRGGVTNRNAVRRLVRQVRTSAGNDEAKLQASYYAQLGMKIHTIDRVLAKCIASMRENMVRVDDAMSLLSEEDDESWIVMEVLTWNRRLMNTQVDRLLRLRRRFRLAHEI